MVLGKLLQIRVDDKVVVFQFYENENVIGSRGISVSDDEINQIAKMTLLDLLPYFQGKEVPAEVNDRTPLLDKIMYNAYQEYLQAKEQEEKIVVINNPL